jgi:TorA maturation chaperone TorD
MTLGNNYVSAMNSRQADTGQITNNAFVNVTPVCADRDLAHDEALTRSLIYQYLANIYLSPPGEDMLQCLNDDSFVAALPAIFSPEMAREFEQYTETIQPEKELPRLKQEFMDLFVVPAGRYVTPFEDVYRGLRQDGQQEGGPLLGERAIAAKIMYRGAGALMESQCKELPSHIGVELSFMAFLCQREASSLQDNDAVALADDLDITEATDVYRLYQLLFLQQHLNDWFPQLNLSIQAKAETTFYKGLSQLTEDFISWDMLALLPATDQKQ